MENIEKIPTAMPAPDDALTHVASADQNVQQLVKPGGDIAHAQEAAEIFQNQTRPPLNTAAETIPALPSIQNPTSVQLTPIQNKKEEISHASLGGVIKAAILSVFGYDVRPGNARNARKWNHLEDTRSERIQNMAKGLTQK